MGKIKDFGSFVNENNNIENINENFMDIITAVGYGIGAIVTSGFVGYIGSVAVSGILKSLEDTKLGDRGKEFADKIKSLFSKGAQIKKEGGDEIEYAEEVCSELENYEDIISELEDGKLGEDGKKLAEQLNKVKNAAEEV